MVERLTAGENPASSIIVWHINLPQRLILQWLKVGPKIVAYFIVKLSHAWYSLKLESLYSKGTKFPSQELIIQIIVVNQESYIWFMKYENYTILTFSHYFLHFSFLSFSFPFISHSL